MKIAIATSAEMAALTEGDRAFASRLEAKGARVFPVVWTEGAPREEWDCLLVRTVWGYYKQCPEFVAWVNARDREGLVLNGPELIRWNADKAYLPRLESCGIPIVPSFLVSPGEDLSLVAGEIASRGWKEIVVKPTISASSFLTWRLPSGAVELEGRLREILRHSRALVQPFLPSIAEAGEVSLIYFNGLAPELSHSVHKRPKGGDFRVQAEFGGLTRAYSPSAEEVRVAEKLLALVPEPWVFARIDFVYVDGAPVLSELELIEPHLFLEYDEAAPERFAAALLERLES